MRKITTKTFEKRDEAVKYIIENQETQLGIKLFGHDKKPYLKKNGKPLEGAKRYITATYEDMYNTIKRYKRYIWNYYEFWLLNAVCLFVDYDLYVDYCPTEKLVKKVCRRIINALIKLLKREYKINVKSDDFIKENGSRDGKLSIHIKCKRIRFKDIEQQMQFWKVHKDEIDEDIDMSVYQYHMPLKLVYSHKWMYDGQINKSIPMNGDEFTLANFKKYSVTCFDIIDDVIDFPKFDVPDDALERKAQAMKRKDTCKSNVKKIYSSLEEKYNNYKPKYSKSDLKQYLEQLSFIRAIDFKLWIYVGMAFKNCEYKGNFDDWLEFSKQYYGFDEEECRLRWSKFKLQDECDKLLYNEATIRRWAFEDNPLFKPIVPLRDLCKETKEKDYFGCQVERIEERYLSNCDLFDPNYRTFIIKSPPGSDKTGSIIKFISELEANSEESDGLLVCTSRRNLSIAITSRSKKGYYGYRKGKPLIGITNYEDIKVKKNYQKEKYLAITPNSLIHLNFDKTIPHKKIFWIDEVTPFLQYLTSSILSDRRRVCIEILKWYIKTCEYLIISDADLNDDSLKAIMDIRKTEDAKLCINSYKNDDWTYYFTTVYGQTIKRIKDLLDNGKRVYVCTDSYKITEQLAIIFRNYSKLVYNAKSSKEVRDTIKNINDEWSKVQLIITNTVNQYGVGYDPFLKVGQLPYFYAVFGIFRGHILTGDGAYQLLHRIRKTESRECHICLYGIRRRFLPTNIDTIKKVVKINNDRIVEILNGLDPETIKEIREYDFKDKIEIDDAGRIKSIKDRDEWFDDVFYRTLRSKFESLNNFEGWLRFRIEEAGGQIMDETIECSEESLKEIGKLIEESGTTFVNNEANKVFGAKDITSMDANDIIRRGNLTIEEVYELKKFHLKRTSGISDLSFDIVNYAINKNPNFQDQLDNFRKFVVFNDNQVDLVHEMESDYSSIIGLHSTDIKIKMIKSMLKLIGWSDKINNKDVYVCKGGRYAAKANDGVKKYWEKNQKILMMMFGEVARIRFDTKKAMRLKGEIIKLEGSMVKINGRSKLREIEKKIKTIEDDIKKIYVLTDVKFMDMLVRIVNEFMGLSCLACKSKQIQKNNIKFYEYKYFWNSLYFPVVTNNMFFPGPNEKINSPSKKSTDGKVTTAKSKKVPTKVKASTGKSKKAKLSNGKTKRANNKVRITNAAKKKLEDKLNINIIDDDDDQEVDELNINAIDDNQKADTLKLLSNLDVDGQYELWLRSIVHNGYVHIPKELSNYIRDFDPKLRFGELFGKKDTLKSVLDDYRHSLKCMFDDPQ